MPDGTQTVATDAAAATGTPTTNDAPADAALGAATQAAQAEAAGTQQQEAGQTKDSLGQETAEGAEKAAAEKVPGAENLGAPESYTFKAPEGAELDAPITEAFAEVARELNLSEPAAQKVLDKMAPLIAQRNAEALQEASERARSDWSAASRSDSEFGGDKLSENLAVANQAFNAFTTPALRELLSKSGLIEHPEVIRTFYRVGQRITPDKTVVSGTAPRPPRSPAEVLYPNSKDAT